MAVLIWSTLMRTISGGAFCRPPFQAAKVIFADVTRILAVVAVAEGLL